MMDGNTAIDIERLNRLSNSQPAALESSLVCARTTNDSEIYAASSILETRNVFRVLDLIESPQLEDPLIGSLRVVSFHQDLCPKFNALSYAWGPQAEIPDTIQLTQPRGSIAITRNCRDALRRIRQLYGNVSIWVDAICIDQHNKEEKAHQIPLMKDIYTWAEFVYIWLGPENLATCKAMKCLIKAGTITLLPLNRNPGQRGPNIWTYTLGLLFPFVESMVGFNRRKKGRTLWAEYGPKDLVEFINQDWFTHTWTFQEIVLASSPVILTPSHTIRWEVLLRGFSCLKYGFIPPYRHQRSRDCMYYHERPNPEKYYAARRPREFRRTSRVLAKLHGTTSTVEAFDRLLAIWMRIDRPKIWKNLSGSHSPVLKHSFHDYQNPYFRISEMLRPFIGVWYFVSIASLGAPALWLAFTKWENGNVSGLILIFVLIFSFGLSLWIDGLFKLLTVATAYEHDRKTVPTIMDGIVQSLRERNATEPKDRSYAIYGVLESLGLQLSQINYNRCRGKVYHALLLDLLIWDSSAIVLLLDAGKLLDCDKEMAECPSWVPDWNALPEKPTISSNFFLHDRTLHAALGSEPQIKISETRNSITVRGNWKGYVTFCTAKFRQIDWTSVEFIQQSVTTLQNLFHAMDSTPNRSIPQRLRYVSVNRGRETTEQEVIHPIRPAIPAAINPLDLLMLKTRQNAVYAHDLDLKMMQDLHKIFYSTGFPKTAAEITHQLKENKKIWDFFIDVVNDLAINERRIFISSDGFRGCGSKDMKVGDRLALVAGVPAPLVLRPIDSNQPDWSETEYTVSCSAFVLGWMKGSYFTINDVKDIKLV